jgi:CubicO group peptidase (beta-lactamase class C family)
MKLKRATALLASALLLFVFVLSSPAIAQDSARMDQVARSYTDELKTFMGSLLVARDGQVLISRGYGSANLEWTIPNTPATKFRLGSITKQFTAAAILLLEERGKLRIDDPVKKHLEDTPAAWDQVTIFHLLTHTSGIPSFTGFPDYRTAKLVSTTAEKIVASFRDKPLEFQPGEKWNYSNSGYLLLGHLIEKLSGQTYEQYIRENIFTPLVMRDSGYDSNRTVTAQRASGYSPSPNGLVNAEFIHMTVPHAAGALYSTTEDLLRWTQGLYAGKLLSPASLQKMTTPFKSDYAFGLVVRTVNGRRVFDHDGGIEGFNTTLTYYPDTRLTIAVLANLNGPASREIATKLGAVAHGDTVTLSSERQEIMVAPEVLARYVGTYEITPTMNMTITLVDGKLMTQLGGQRALPLFAESETTFFLKVVDAQVEFVTDQSGTVMHAIMRQGGRDQKAPRK